MATAARTITVFLGGAGGGYVYNNMPPDGLRSVARDVLFRERPDGSPPPPPAPAVDALALERLAARIDAMGRDAGRPVVVYGGGEGGGSGVWVWVAVAAGVGGACYCWRMGYSVGDFLWVSRKAFKGIERGVEDVRGALEAVRVDMKARLKRMGVELEGVCEGVGKIEGDVGEVRVGVQAVQKDVGAAGDMLRAVTGRIEALDGRMEDGNGRIEGRIEMMAEQLDKATTGVMALVDVVSAMGPARAVEGPAFAGLRNFAEIHGVGGAKLLEAGHTRTRTSGSLLAALEGPESDRGRGLTKRSSFALPGK